MTTKMGDLLKISQRKAIRTRRQQKQDKRKERFQRQLIVRFKVQKFTNPFNCYKIFYNFCIEERMQRPVMTINTLLKWNRIASASMTGSVITFELNPINIGPDISPQYIIDRFKSYGNKALNEFAIKIQHLLQLNQIYTPEQTQHFTKSKDLIQNAQGKLWMLLTGDYSESEPRFTKICMTKQIVQSFGFSPQQIMVQSVKTGVMPVQADSQNSDFNFQACSKYLSLLLMYRTMCLHKTYGAIKALSTISKDEIRAPVESLNGVAFGVEVSTRFSSPTDMFSEIRQVIRNKPMVLKNQDHLIDDEEYQTLRKLIKVPAECCQRSKGKICKYRAI